MGDKLFLGFEAGSGKPIHIPVFHTLITGLTQVGKTETIRALMKRAAEAGYTVLIMDVKKKTTGRSDFADIGREIPIYLTQSTDTLVLKGLLESEGHMRLNFQFSELIRVSEKAKDYAEVKANLDGLLSKEKLHPIQRDKLETLRFLFDRLLVELGKTKVAGSLALKQGEINVMDLTGRSDAFKQLVVKSVCEYIRNNVSNIIVVFDEAHIHIPQEYGSASKKAVTTLIKEGASSKQFVVLADQTITEIDKDPIKQCDVWLLGRQRELNEAERTFKQLPDKNGIKAEDIMRLPVGFFLTSTHEWVTKVYVKPDWVEESLAIRIAKGEVSVDDAVHLSKRKEDDADLVWKEKYDELLEKYKEAEGLRRACVDSHDHLAQGYEEQKKELEKAKASIEPLRRQISSLEATAKLLDPLKQLLASLVPSTQAAMATSNQTHLKSIAVQGEELTIKVQKPIEKTLEFRTETNQGKIMFIIIVEKKGAPTSEKEIIEAATERGWVLNHNNTAPELGKLANQGILVREQENPIRYRPPAKLRFEVAK